jgi:hypothetical protein
VQRHTNGIRPERLCSVHGNERYVLKAFDGVPLVKAESLLNDYGGKAQAMPERLLVNVRAHFRRPAISASICFLLVRGSRLESHSLPPL